MTGARVFDRGGYYLTREGGGELEVWTVVVGGKEGNGGGRGRREDDGVGEGVTTVGKWAVGELFQFETQCELDVSRVA